MVIEAVAETVLNGLTELAMNRLARRIKVEDGVSAEVNRKDAASALRHHIGMVGRWATDISFRDLWKSKDLRDSFVDLNLSLGTVRLADGTTPRHTLNVSDVVDLPGHFVLLGDPGSGKTTSLKRLALALFEQRSSPATHGARRTDSAVPIPILIRLRELGENDSLTSFIIGLLGIVMHPKEQHRQAELRIVAQYLDQLNCFLLIDGLDEVHPKLRPTLLENLRYLFFHTSTSRVFLTCRTAEFVYSVENASVASIRPLSASQIKLFARRWLGEERAHDFINKVRQNPYSGSEVRPLTLAHLCAIYERSGTVPEKPKTVYKKVVRLFIEEWDEQRSVQRHTQYAHFELDRKEEFLEAMAFHLSAEYGRTRFSHDELLHAYKRVHEQFGLPLAEMEKVVREVESHTGLIMEVAYEVYEFAHKSLQEYLTAAYMLKLPSLPDLLFPKLPDETALVIALSSDPVQYFIAVCTALLDRGTTQLSEFTGPFLRRLELERVDLSHSNDIGLALLALYSDSYINDPGLRTNYSSRAAFFSFVTNDPMFHSIGEILRTASVSKLAGNLYRVRVSGSFRTTLRIRSTRVNPDFTVDSEFLQHFRDFREPSVVIEA